MKWPKLSPTEFTAMRAFVRLERQRALFRNRPAIRYTLLGLVICLLPLWQYTFWAERNGLDDQYRIVKSFGAAYHFNYVYFLHTLGIYPVSNAKFRAPATADAAEKLLRRHRDTFYVDKAFDRGSVLLLLPHIYLGGDIHKPRFNAANALGFTAALLALFLAFWWVRLELLGLALVALFGSNPFLLYETYANNNVFGWTATFSLLVTALFVPLLASHRYYFEARNFPLRKSYLWATPVVAGLILGTAQTIRTEAAAVAVVAFVPLLLHKGFPRARRLWLAATFAATLLITQNGWNLYFNRLTVSSIATLKEMGGTRGHALWQDKTRKDLWHSVWTGLGDFDGKYGYLWEDLTAFSYAAPIVDRIRNKPNLTLQEQPAYAAVVRDHVLGNIARDPLWYAGIIARRLWTTLFENTPPGIAVGKYRLTAPALGYVLFPFTVAVLVLCVWCRAWLVPGLVLFLFAGGLVTIAITSGVGFKYLMNVHMLMYAVMAGWGVEAGLLYSGRRRGLAANGAGPEPAATG